MTIESTIKRKLPEHFLYVGKINSFQYRNKNQIYPRGFLF